jgi:hypothetical protein
MPSRSGLASVALVSILAVATACDGGPTSATDLTDAGAPLAPAGASQGSNRCLGLPVAPRNQRVDLAKPTFSNPTEVTNPLFPISQLARVVLLGTVDGEPFRAETTLLPETREIDLKGKTVETLVSQYLAIHDRQIAEVALDYYAQADDGAAWYFGEDVFNYEDGAIVDTEGTWLAGRDGPAAMIMPADPEVGDVYRPENICGLVFEEVTVLQTGVTVDGPRGPVPGAIVVRELHMDGTTEDKTFAPGYGEFFTGSGGDVEAVAVAIPTDALSGPPPAELVALSTGAAEIFDLAQAENWADAASTVGDMTDAWDALKAASVPPRLESQMDDALAALDDAVQAEDVAETRQAAVDLGRAALDLELQHRTVEEIDLRELELFARQLLVDAEAADQAGVISDAAVIRWIRERIADDVLSEKLAAIDARIEGLRAAAEARDLLRAAASAKALRETISRTAGIGRRR